MNKNIAIFLAPGFEEIEAVTILDVLRRAELSVELFGVGDGSFIEGSHGITVVIDKDVEKFQATDFKMLVLPGGMPASTTLASSDVVLKALRDVYEQGDYIAAICAAPLALSSAGLIGGRVVTAYPGIEDKLGNAIYTGKYVEVDGRIITGSGPGSAMAFSLQLVEVLVGKEKADSVANQLLFSR